MRPLKVTMLTTSFPLSTESISGIFVARLIKNLPKNISTVVVTPGSQGSQLPGGSQGQLITNAFRYAPKKMQVLAHNPGGIPVALKNHKWAYLLLPQFLFAMFVACWRTARHSDVIHANWAICGCIAGLVGKLIGVPLVTTLRGEDVTRAKKRVIDRMILLLCLRLSAKVVAVSHAIANWILIEHPSMSSRVQVIENGVDESFLKVGAHRLWTAHSPFTLITVGSLIPRKEISSIVEALVLVTATQDIQLNIIGSGPEESELRKMVARLDLLQQVRFLGSVTPESMPNLLSCADMLILASSSEGRPNVILEAMAAGVPVIASAIDGVTELVEDGVTGLLFSLGDSKCLARQIDKLSQDPQMRDKLAKNARKFIVESGLMWSNTGSRYAALYDQLITSRLTSRCV